MKHECKTYSKEFCSWKNISLQNVIELSYLKPGTHHFNLCLFLNLQNIFALSIATFILKK